MTAGWMIEAIEAAALRRAEQQILSDPYRWRMFGMDAETVLALKEYFLSRNAVEEHELTPNLIRSRAK